MAEKTRAEQKPGKRIFLDSFTSNESEGEQDFTPSSISTPVVSQPNRSRVQQPGLDVKMPTAAEKLQQKEEEWAQERMELQKKSGQLAAELEDTKTLLHKAADAKKTAQQLRLLQEEAAQLQREIEAEREEKLTVAAQLQAAEEAMKHAADVAREEERQRLQADAANEQLRDELNATIQEHKTKKVLTASEKMIEKMNYYPTYDGTGDIDVFLSQLTEILEKKGVNEAAKKLAFRTSLRGKAALAPEFHLDNDANITYQGMCESARSRFKKFKSFATITSDLRKIVRASNESIEDFAARVETVAHNTKMSATQRQLKCRDAFVMGINHHAMQHYIEHRDEDKVCLSDALKLARDYEHEFGSYISSELSSSTASRSEASSLVAAIGSTTVAGADKPSTSSQPDLSDQYASKAEVKGMVTKLDKFINEYYKDKTERIEKARKRWGNKKKNGNGGNGNNGGGKNNNNSPKPQQQQQSSGQPKPKGGAQAPAQSS